MITEIENRLLREISAKTAYEHNKTVAEFGVRLTGGEAAKKTEEYFRQTCLNNGLQVYLEEYELDCFDPLSWELAISYGTVSKKLDCQPMMFCPATREAGISAEIVFVGYGEDDDYAKRDVTGKIVLMLREPTASTISFYQELCNASKHGAVGAILINNQPWPFIGTLEAGYFDPEKRLLPIEPNAIPFVCISSVEGQALRSVLEQQKVTANLTVNAITEKRSVNNVRAILPGTEKPEEKVVFCAHLDSHGNMGANDNATGLSILLELARVFSMYPSKRTIEFLATGNEETISMGAYEYCKRHRSELKNIVCVLNVDMVGVGSHLYIMSESRWPDKLLTIPEWLTSHVQSVAKELNYDIKTDTMDLSSDEGRFLDAGVPAIFFWKPNDDRYHSPLDLIEYVDPNTLKVVGEIVALSAWRLANQ